MPRGAGMSLTFNQPTQVAPFIQIQTIPTRMHQKWKEIIDIVCKTTNGLSEDQLLTKSSIEVKDNSVVKVIPSRHSSLS